MKKSKSRYTGIIYGVLALLLLSLSFCSESDMGKSLSNGSETGQGGSMARFTISGDYLYTVDHQSLNIFDIHDIDQPEYVKSESVGFGIETIHPKEDMLFLGSQFGMYIYSVESPESPKMLSQYDHIYSCDPVVTDNEYAYVTLHSEDSRCGRTTNELQIVSIDDPKEPKHVISYDMKSPRGLGVRNKTLYLCDDGLKVFDVSDVNNIKRKDHYDINAMDCIVLENLLLIIGKGGFYQYSHKNDTIKYLSKIEVQKE